jgi:hypothetical protein
MEDMNVDMPGPIDGKRTLPEVIDAFDVGDLASLLLPAQPVDELRVCPIDCRRVFAAVWSLD